MKVGPRNIIMCSSYVVQATSLLSQDGRYLLKSCTLVLFFLGQFQRALEPNYRGIFFKVKIITHSRVSIPKMFQGFLKDHQEITIYVVDCYNIIIKSLSASESY